MKLDSQYPFNIVMFVADNAEYYQKRMEETYEGCDTSNPDLLDKRVEDNEEEIISDMTEAYEEKMREEYNF